MSKEITSTTFLHGSKGSIGATALQLTAVSNHVQRGVTVKADAGNGANFVFVGRSSAVTAGIAAPTTDGYKLAAGEEVFIEIEDPSLLYVIGSTTGLAVCWMAS